MGAFLDKGLGHRRDRIDIAIEPDGGVDAMSEQVTGNAAAGRGDIEPPKARAALRELGGNSPVLQELGAIMEDSAKFPFIDKLLGKRDSGNSAVVVPNHVRHFSFLN